MSSLKFTTLTLLVISSGLTAASVTHYPPASTNINNLTYALSGSGAPGIYNSSKIPDHQYGQYNWCNMPHVRPQEYKKPASNYTLKYVEVIQRHHKRTPYASNTFFKEDVAWNCDGFGPLSGLKTAKGPGSLVPHIQWEASTNPQNPFTNTVGPGFVHSTCQFPQITAAGLEDAITHGADLRAVYADRLHLRLHFDPSAVQIRVTNNQITSQVASGLLEGLFPLSSGSTVEVHIQASSFDSLEPAYPCARADRLKTAITQTQEWNGHLKAAAKISAQLDKVSGIAAADGGWHSSFDHYYDNLSAKQCHGKPLPCSLNDTSVCVSQDLANTVYRIGNWEYSWIFRDSPDSAAFAALRYGGWVLELKAHLQEKISGASKIRYRHNIAHDGSISPLLGFLQIKKMVWPGMGSEVVFELYRSSTSSGRHSSLGTLAWFVRVLWGGQPLESSTPLGVLDMVPVDVFFAYIDSMIGSGSDLLAACASQ